MTRAGGAARVRRVGLVLAGLVGVVLPIVTAPPAAATDYRYWSYWQADGGTWVFASVGPGATRPADGAVEGWRFAVSPTSGGPAPRTQPDFDAVCAATPRREGTKRVAVVIDSGTPDEAPGGERPPEPRAVCAQVPEDASGAEVLASVSETRFNGQGILCGIDGYPGRGCAEPVRADDRSADDGTSSPDGIGGVPGVVVGVALVAGVGALAVNRARRTRE